MPPFPFVQELPATFGLEHRIGLSDHVQHFPANDDPRRHARIPRRISAIAPTGTIGLLMDCDTTGIEPDFALVKFKRLAGGGYFKIINRAVPAGLRALGYKKPQIDDIITYALGHTSLLGAPHINHESLHDKGFTKTKIDEIEDRLWVCSNDVSSRIAFKTCSPRSSQRPPGAFYRKSGERDDRKRKFDP